jgi:hypothetical protein
MARETVRAKLPVLVREHAWRGRRIAPYLQTRRRVVPVGDTAAVIAHEDLLDLAQLDRVAAAAYARGDFDASETASREADKIRDVLDLPYPDEEDEEL